jgi:hypothetical protein
MDSFLSHDYGFALVGRGFGGGVVGKCGGKKAVGRKIAVVKG